MPVDTFICGTCQTNFNDITLFVEHKKEPCKPPEEPVNIHILEQEDKTVHIVAEPLTSPFETQQIKTEQVDAEEPFSVQHVQVFQVPLTSDGVRLTKEQAEAVVNAAAVSKVLNATGDSFLESLVRPDDAGGPVPAEPVRVAKTPASGRKRGRPRKGEEKKKIIVVEKPVVKEVRDPSVGIDNDGRLNCPRCKRTFTRLRHYNTHRCLANSDYVDITKKEALPDLENEPDSDLDYEEPVKKPKFSPRAKIVKLEKIPVSDALQVLDSGEHAAPNVTIEMDMEATADASQSAALTYASSTTAPVKERPIFETDTEKKQFEENLNIDLSQIDHMFKTHIIEQNVNEHAPPPANRVSPELTIFSCNTCDKVFKTISHMRHHCLIHTNLKPFKCPKCPYASNSKGNLYTHIRKHTGQFFSCTKCNFKTVNRSHLNEHLGTHSIRKIKCRLCKKDYSTNKSLYNHVRKYHGKTEVGSEYLKEFTPRVNKGQAVLHQCHICNRKFKKRMDRDRHLFIHNIKTNPNVFSCELCDYTASRRVYLENHIRKHRIVYQCAACLQKFLSTIRLNDHISEKHLGEEAPEPTEKDWGDLFEASINSSLYLPEPDGTIDHIGHSFLKAGEKEAEVVNVIVSNNEDSQALLELKDVVDQSMKPHDANDVQLSHVMQELAAPLPAGTEQSQTDTEQLPTVVEQLQNAETEQLPASADQLQSETEQLPASVDQLQAETEQLPASADQLQAETEQLPASADQLQAETEQLPASADQLQAETEQLPASADQLQSDPESIDASNQDDHNNDKVDDTPHAGDGAVLQETKSNSGDAIPGEQVEMNQDASKENNSVDNSFNKEREDGLESMDVDETHDDDDADEDTEKVASIEGPAPRELLSYEAPTIAEKCADIFQRLEYQPMNMNILTKLRETFGNQECEFCGRLFYSQLDYEPHLRTHTGDKPFACEDCDYRSITRDNLKRHREKHHFNVSLKCDRCDYVATGRTQLWTHQHKHKEEESPSNECPVCKDDFPSKKALGAHILTTHPNMSRAEARKATGYNHRIQGKIGRRSYKCPYCDKVFTRANSDLQKHIWIHEGIKPFKCSLCPHACRSLNNLKNHMLRHSQNKPFMCGDCGKLYKSRTALRWHMRSHREGKLFKCTRCPYEGIQKSHLKRHMETHDVMKKYMCDYCDYSANTLGYMKIHHTKFHRTLPQKEDARPTTSTTRELPPNTKAFKCLSCDYIFGNIWDIKRHLKVRHHLHVEDIRALETTEVSRIVPADVVSGQETEMGTGVQVIEVNNLAPDTIVPSQTDEEEAREALETLQYSTVAPVENIDEKTASAVNILQQIIDMSQQGAFPNQSQQITVQSEDGQLVTMNPETIILQQEDGQELVLAADGGHTLESGEFVIQVMNEANIVTGTETIISSAPGPIPEGVTEVLSVSSENDFFQTVQEETNVITTIADDTV